MPDPQSSAMVPEGYELVETQKREGPLSPVPQGGTWEDRGIGGAVFHPTGGGNPELHRVDNSILGVPPELVATGVAGIGRAVAAPGLTAAQRAVAGAGAAAHEAAPWLKYEGAKHVLKAMGLPEVIASPLAYMFVVKTGGKGAPAAAEDAAAAAPKNVTPAAETSLELTRRLKAENLARHGGLDAAKAKMAEGMPASPPVAPPAAPVAAASTQTPTAQAVEAFKQAGQTPGKGDVSWVATWIKRGLSPADALKKLQASKPVAETLPTVVPPTSLPPKLQEVYAQLRAQGQTQEQAMAQVALIEKLGTGSIGDMLGRISKYAASGNKRWTKVD